MSLSGEVNLPYGTILTEQSGLLFYDGKPLFRITSENAFQYASRNDDGKGKERGALVDAIKTKLAKRDTNYQKRWDKIWADPLARSFKLEDSPEEMFIWGFGFYNADIADLKHIAELVGAVKGGNYV